MSTFEEFILEERHDQSKSPDLKVEKAVIQAAEKRLTAMVLIGLIGALLGVFGHHWFLFIINGQRAEAQFWIKTASNAFSQIVTLFMGIVAASSLTQSVRSINMALYLLTHPLDLAGIDQGVHPDLSHRQSLFPPITAIHSRYWYTEEAPIYPTPDTFSRHSVPGRSEHFSAKLAHRERRTLGQYHQLDPCY